MIAYFGCLLQNELLSTGNTIHSFEKCLTIRSKMNRQEDNSPQYNKALKSVDKLKSYNLYIQFCCYLEILSYSKNVTVLVQY